MAPNTAHAANAFVANGSPARSTAPLRSAIGRTLAGRYVIESLIGQGASANVYRGRHLVIQRPVAIKIVYDNPESRGPLVEAVLQEARLAARLDHENVVDILDFGTLDGMPWVAMELLEGEPLSQRCAREGGLRLASVRRIMRQLCGALEAAHSAKIIHRDLKPSNIMCLPREHDPDFIKLLDFGIAALETTAKFGAPTPTMIAGSPAYMAPEVQHGRWSRQSDIYSAGIVLYELLTGTVPFDSPSAQSILAKHRHASVPPVATRTDRKIPSGFDLVLARALAKNPTERYGSIRAFWEDVEMAACGLLDAVGTEVADFGERVTARIPVIQLGLDPHKRSLAGIIVCDNRGSGKRVDMAVPRPSRALPAAHRIRERTGIAGLPSSGSRVVARIHPQRGVSPVQCLPARVRPTRLPGEFDRVRIADEASPRRGARVRGLAEKAPPRRGARGFALAVVALALLATNVRSPEAEKLAEDIGQLSRSVYRSVKSMTDLPMDCSTRPCRTIGLVHRS